MCCKQVSGTKTVTCSPKNAQKKKNVWCVFFLQQGGFVEISESQPFLSPRCLWCPVSNSLPPLAFRNDGIGGKIQGQKNGSFFVGFFARFGHHGMDGWIFISFLSEFLHRESLQLGHVSRLLSCKSGIIWCMAAPKLAAPKNGWMDGKQRLKINQSQHLWSQVATLNILSRSHNLKHLTSTWCHKTRWTTTAKGVFSQFLANSKVISFSCVLAN